ncbi:hypothetical protein GCM10022222_13970 [Amycolatopsis ultiminotia]|uniref:Uncharacterized protein n=1 Tax=Amycolatopsis ultiminotia TaxID=543629 RepID=A0ABP6VEA9_9PSEU
MVRVSSLRRPVTFVRRVSSLRRLVALVVRVSSPRRLAALVVRVSSPRRSVVVVRIRVRSRRPAAGTVTSRCRRAVRPGTVSRHCRLAAVPGNPLLVVLTSPRRAVVGPMSGSRRPAGVVPPGSRGPNRANRHHPPAAAVTCRPVVAVVRNRARHPLRTSAPRSAPNPR